MFPQKLFPLNMVRSNWMEMIFEAWNAIDFTPNGMSNEHWSSMKKEFIIQCYSMSDRYLRNKSRSFYLIKVFQAKKTASIMVLACKIQSNLFSWWTDSVLVIHFCFRVIRMIKVWKCDLCVKLTLKSCITERWENLLMDFEEYATLT